MNIHNDNNEIRYLKGVGPQKEKAFNDLGLKTVNDLLFYYPRDYEDRTKIIRIAAVESDFPCCVEGTVISVDYRRIRKNLSIIKVLITDGSGHMNCTWFNQDFIRNKLTQNRKYIFYGKAFRNGFIYEFNSPSFSDDSESFMRIVPVYRKNSDLTQNFIRKCMSTALKSNKDRFIDILPENILSEYRLLEFNSSIRNIHFPESNELFFKARERLVFEELFLLQLVLLKIREGIKSKANKFRYTKNSLNKKLIEKLPFKLTNAQMRVIEEISNDLHSDRMMNRLVQGDVGSGKTIVAVTAILNTFENHYQSAFMAPTEILAKQHFNTLCDLLKDFNVNIVFLSGSLSQKEKKEVTEEISSGKADLVIGTHAIIQDKVEFKNLGLVITDEQHRFGVDQRAMLSKKGDSPHVLVMTATPIPRTLALILYGDLDISVLDEMPAGRIPVETFVVTEQKRKRVNEFIRKRLENKEQVFVVCPVIEESQTIDVKNVNEVYENTKKVFKDSNIEMIHGKIKNDEKEKIMDEFKNGHIDILVSTTVIEVGVDIKNATMMVIENAERFGIAQLHQLRGRVGRSDRKSYCILYNGSSSMKAGSRLKELENSNDGFYLSEQDLMQRGPGEFFGTRQHGIPELKIANLYTDIAILKNAQKAAMDIINDDIDLRKEKYAFIKETIKSKINEIIIE